MSFFAIAGHEFDADWDIIHTAKEELPILHLQKVCKLMYTAIVSCKKGWAWMCWIAPWQRTITKVSQYNC